MGLWTKKSLDELQATETGQGRRLQRSLSAFDLTLFGMGAIIGAGLFSITGVAAAENAGPAIIISFIIAAIGCTFAGLCYSEMAAMIPISGSAYTYTYATLGEFPAWVIGWSLVLEYAIGAATVAISWSGYAVSLLHDFGVTFPVDMAASPWDVMHSPDTTLYAGLINIPALSIVVLVSIILIAGIRFSATFNAVIVSLKVGVIIAFICVGAFYIDPANYVPFIPENSGEFGHFGWSGIFRAAGVVFFAYIGFDSVSTMAQEANSPQTTVPRAILGSLVICTLIYILFSFIMTGLANYKDLDVAAPVAVAVAKTPFFWMDWLVKLAILGGLTSVILVFLLGQSRIFFSMARDGLLPRCFGVLHPRFQTPWVANLILMVLVGLIAAFVPISVVSHMTSIGTLFAFVVVCAGVLILRYTRPHYLRPFKTPLFPYVPLLGMLTCGWMMATLDPESWLRLILWLAIGLVIYFTYGRYHR